MILNKKIKTMSLGVVLGAAMFVGVGQADAASVKVERGDTLSHLAKEYKTTVSNIKQLNGLKSDKIYMGQTLKVSNEIVSVKRASAVENTHKIQKGDTLSKIAKKYGTTVTNLKQINGLKSDKIYVGQVLKITGKATTSTTATVQSTPAKQATTVQVASNDVRSLIVSEAKKYMGVPYKWGGTTPSGFDCSGFIYYVLKQEGVSNTRYTTASYLSAAKKVSTPQIGDLVFFQNTYRNGVSHIGIYVGDGKMIHASSSGVKVETFKSGYWATKFLSYGTMIK